MLNCDMYYTSFVYHNESVAFLNYQNFVLEWFIFFENVSLKTLSQRKNWNCTKHFGVIYVLKVLVCRKKLCKIMSFTTLLIGKRIVILIKSTTSLLTKYFFQQSAVTLIINYLVYCLYSFTRMFVT